MRRFAIAIVLSFSILFLNLFAQRGTSVFTSDVPDGLPKPWTATPSATQGGRFSFTVFGDRTGMAYPGRMEKALAMVDSQFVMSVGDNVEGYTSDAATINRMWI